MPKITYIRFWCSNCKEFTLQLGKKCIECETENTSYFLKDVPIEKILAQRKRYKEFKRKQFEEIISLKFLTANIQQSMFTSPEENIEIIETDAGQKKIDEKETQERNERYNKIAEEKRALKEEYCKFKHLNRNDVCICGSGKKYKNCCLTKFKNV